MARTARRKSSSGYYHIMIRGVNKQVIFNDDQDRRHFVRVMRTMLERDSAELAAYCLMNNHVHFLLRADDPGAFLKRIASSYVYYYNRKYDRVGHLFQDRFKSEPVDDESYFLTVFRYILRNPEAAGICKTEEYPWSSYREMSGQQDICTCSLAVRLAGGLEALEAFVSCDNEDECMDLDKKKDMDEQEIRMLVKELARVEEPEYIRGLPKDRRDQMIRGLLLAGLTPRQLSAVTHISRDTIRKVQGSVPS